MDSLRVIGFMVAIAACFASHCRGQQAGPLNPRELFEELDSNSDRVVVTEEVPEAGRPAFQNLLAIGDSDHDGKLEAEEYQALVQKASIATRIVPMPPQRFKALDTNGDGRVSKDEFTGPPARFTQLDANRDGFITRGEAGAPGGAAPPGMGALAARLKAMDKNTDGKISREEFTGPAPRFDKIDADHDGFVTLPEFRRFTARAALTAPGQGALARFDAIDKDKNGKLSREEFPGPKPLFDRLDADQDGSLTRVELRKAGGAQPPKK